MRFRGLGLSLRLLRQLMRLYPRPFRQAYGWEMARVFRLRYRRAMLQDGFPSVARLWARTLLDLVKTAWAEHRVSCLDAANQDRQPVVRLPQEPRGDKLMTSIAADLKIAVRGLLKRPGFALGAVLTLALGIGANSAIFSLIHSIVLQPLPYPDPDRILMVYRTSEQGRNETFSFFDFEDWQRASRSFSHLAAFHETNGTLIAVGGSPVYLQGQAVSASLFPLLGVQPLLGRGFSPEEDREGGPRALVLSHALWKSRFGADPRIVGQVVEYQELQHTIVGVMPEGFYFPDPDARFWVTLQGNDLLKRAGIQKPGRGLTFVLVMGRLRPEAGLAAAQAELQSLNDAIEKEHSIRHREILLVPRLKAVVGDVSPLLWTLLASVGLVLLIACANVANLSLSRAASRQKEMALRNALGASRQRLVRQMLTESALLAAMGAVLAIAVAVGLLGWLASAGGELLPRYQEISLDRTVLLFTAAAAVFSSLLFGLAPALKSSHPRLQAALQAGGRSSGGASPRLQKSLVVCQVALALVLLSGAGLLVNSFIRLTSVPVGFRPDGLLTLWLSLSEERYPQPDSVLGFYEHLVDRLQGLPEVESASYSYSLPFSGNIFRQTIQAEGMPAQSEGGQWAGTVIVGPNHFETLGVPLLQGRDFDQRDRLESPPVAIINEAMARRYWPDQEALGKRFRRDGGVDGSLDTTRYFRGRPWISVIGVAADVSRTGFQDPPAPEFYVPHAQMPWPSAALVIRSRSEPLLLAEPLRRIIAQQDSRVALHGIDSMQQRMDRSVLPQRLRTQLWTLFALLASSLAVIGVYGVMAFGVSRRTQEIGVRMALGARQGRVLRLVLSQGMRLAALGALLGLLGALATNRALSGLLYEVSATDPLTYTLAAALLLGVAALACYLPARRASRVDPLIALRWE